MAKKKRATSSIRSIAHGNPPISVRQHRSFLLSHCKALANAYSQITQAPIATLVTCTVLALTFLLTTTLLLTLKAFQQMTEYIHSGQQITLYLKPNSQPSKINQYLAELRQDEHVNQVTYISPEQALQELSQQHDYKEILKEVSENPLPPVILLKVDFKDKNALNHWASQVKLMPLVENINLDFNLLVRLSSLIKIANRISYGLAIIFSIGALFIISHTIQGATQKNQQEIHLLQLLGADIPFVRRPFLYLGSLLGLGAGVITLVLLVSLALSIKRPLTEFFQSYYLNPWQYFISSKFSLSLISLSTFLGWLGALVAFYSYKALPE